MVRTIADPVHHRAGQRAAADMDVVRAAVVAPFGAVAHRSRLGDEGVRARIQPDGIPYANSVDAIRPAEVAAVDRQARARPVRLGAHDAPALVTVGYATSGQVQRRQAGP